MDNLGGRRLGQYELGPLLGRGGMASVYQAYQPSLERDVAVKVMLSHLATEATFINSFRREAKAVARLQHPHIITVFDFGVEGDIYYMVMAYISGGTLSDWIRAQRFLSIDDALRITLQLVNALDYAHAQGMVHRDIKPTNVMFTAADHQHAVLTDFGIARLLYEQTTTENKTSGTPAYMSPEVIAGRPADGRADLYALGIMLYEMLTGMLPYQADNPMAMMAQHLYGAVPDLSGFAWPPLLKAMLDTLLAKDPDYRYPSAAAMREMLVRVMGPATGRLSLVGVSTSGIDQPEIEIEIVSSAPPATPATVVELPVPSALMPPPFEWCYVPSGNTTMGAGGFVGRGGLAIYTDGFFISKYPITNAQYNVFIAAPDGYRHLQWWDFGADARQWRTSHPKPKPVAQGGDDVPRTLVAWYDAVAYCRWLAHHLQADIMLPCEAQWQRAAQGDDDRPYPWGNTPPSTALANFGNHLMRLESVTSYPEGASPFGVMGLAGNAREWVLTAWDNGSNDVSLRGNKSRGVRGGGFDSPAEHLKTTYRAQMVPVFENRALGFRCVMATS